MKKKGIIGNKAVFIGVLAILIIVVMSSGSTSIFTNNSAMSESDYKAPCQAVPVSDLINNPDNYTGKNVKYER